MGYVVSLLCERTLQHDQIKSGCHIPLFVNGEFLFYLLIQNNILLLARMFGESMGARKSILYMVELQYVSNNLLKSPTKNEIRRFVVILLLLYSVIIIIVFISMEYFFQL
jgi:hypothetical protein